MEICKKTVPRTFRRRALVVLVFLCVLGPIVHLGLLNPVRIKYSHAYLPENNQSQASKTEISSIDPFVGPPINEYLYPFIILNVNKCLSVSGDRETIHLLLVVKSAVKHFKRRQVIRHTWGWEERFPRVTIRRVFNLGMTYDNKSMKEVMHEQKLYSDIIQSDFVDVYYNDTIKTMMGMRWVVENCGNTQFVLFVDDDFYISMRNVLRFIRHPIGYPNNVSAANVDHLYLPVYNGNHVELLAGSVFVTVTPHMRKSSDFYVSRKEYLRKYSLFVTGDTIIMSIHTLYEMYITSLHTPHSRFVDVYLGLVAHKAGIKPLHNEHFYTGYAPLQRDFKNLIALHRYGNAAENASFWLEQFKLNNA